MTDGVTGSSDSETTVTKYFRGMHHDETATSALKSVSVATTVGSAASYQDFNDLAGLPLQVEHTTIAGTRLSATVTQYWRAVTLDATGDERFDAYFTRVAQVDSYDYGDGSATSPGHTIEATDYDADYGLPVAVRHLGAAGTSSDDTCTVYERFPNTSLWLIDFTAGEELHNLTCAGALHSQTHTRFDVDTYGTPPVDGDPVRTTVNVSSTVTQSTVRSFDTYGRVLTEDATGREPVTTTYTGGAFPTAVRTETTTNGTTHLYSDVTLDQIRGATTTSTGTSQQIAGVAPVTTLRYDYLGRLTGVWQPDRALTDPASSIFVYQIGSVAQPMVTTKVAQSGGYLYSYGLLNSFGEPRENQTPAPGTGGGRTVTATTYDDVGRVAVEQGATYSTGTAGTDGLPDPTLGGTGHDVEHFYDGAGRPTSDRTGSGGTAQFSTTYAYGVGTSTVTPPNQAATITEVDSFGACRS